MTVFGAIGIAAHYYRILERLRPGDSYAISPQHMADIEVPSSPLDKQDGKFKAQWFCDRLSFKCEWDEDIISGWWVFHRPGLFRSSSMAEQPAINRQAVGSSPTSGAKP